MKCPQNRLIEPLWWGGKLGSADKRYITVLQTVQGCWNVLEGTSGTLQEKQ